MKFSKYIKSRLIEILVYFFFFLSFAVFFRVSHMSLELSLFLLFLFFLLGLFLFLFPYFQKKSFYQKFLTTLDALDQKYFIGEMVQKPGFLEGDILVDSILEISKAMNDSISSLRFSALEFREYIELWVHEVKIPLSSCFLILHNHAKEYDQKMDVEIEKISDLVEQILYYARSENVSQDYLIRECSLKSIVRRVIQKNKSRFIVQNMTLDISVPEIFVRTDSKWLEFILHQVINNSIQYAKNEKTKLHIYVENREHQVFLHIEDNGIGISSNDLPRVFDKGFTGENGRSHSTSTGMGLYLCKKLCEKMGHSIQISSVLGEYTRLTIIFSDTDFYSVLK